MQNFDFEPTDKQEFTTQKTRDYFNDVDNWMTLGDGYDYCEVPPKIGKDGRVKICIGADSKTGAIVFDPRIKFNGFAVDLSSFESSLKSIDRIDELIDAITTKQANLGATMNRLESILNVTENNKINWNSSISIIQDADMAYESMNLASVQILQQVSTALFASSCQSKNTVLSLIQQTIR